MVLEACSSNHPLNVGTFKTRHSLLLVETNPVIRKSVPFLEEVIKLKQKKEAAKAKLAWKCDLATEVGARKRLIRRIFHIAKFIYDKLKIQKLVPLIILLLYTFFGGYVIYCVESPVEKEFLKNRNQYLASLQEKLADDLWQAKLRGQETSETEKTQSLTDFRQSVYWYTFTVLFVSGNGSKKSPSDDLIKKTVEHLRFYTDQMAERCWEIRVDIADRPQAVKLLSESLQLYENLTGVSSAIEPIWTFSNAMFLAITIYTTIGYGSIYPHTVMGQVTTILYAICGIPLYLVVVHKMGHFFLALLHNFYMFVLTICHKCRLIKEPAKFHKMSRISFQTGSGDSQTYNVPVSLAIGVTFGWMFACAGLFCLFFETNWDYFTSFYFFFISLTTIGFGDLTPTHAEYMFTTSVLIIIGLSLVSMCISVVQLKLELLFEDLMLSLIEEGELDLPEWTGGSFGIFQIFTALKNKRKKATQRQNQASRLTEAPNPFLIPLLARNRRRVLLGQLNRKINQKSVETQTDKFLDFGTFAQTDATWREGWRGGVPRHEASYAARVPYIPPHKKGSACSAREPRLLDNHREKEQLSSTSKESASLVYLRKKSIPSRSRRTDYALRFRASCDEILHVHLPKISGGNLPTNRRWSESELQLTARPSLLGLQQPSITDDPALNDNYVKWLRMMRGGRLRPSTLAACVHLINRERNFGATQPQNGGGYNFSVPSYIPEPQIVKVKTEQYRGSTASSQAISTANRRESQPLNHQRRVNRLSATMAAAASAGQLPVMYLHRLSKTPANDDFKSLIHEIGARLDDCRSIVQHPPSIGQHSPAQHSPTLSSQQRAHAATTPKKTVKHVGNS